MRPVTIFLYPAILAFALASAPDVTAQPRPLLPIAYVSVQKILAEADDAKAAAKELETLRAARTQELNAKKQALDAKRLEIANSGGFFSRSKVPQLQDEAKRQETELQQATQKAQADMQELQKSVQERLRAELSTVLTAIATQRGFQYVLNQDAALVLAPSGVSLTDEVLAKMNAAAAQRAASTKTGDVPKP
jgi:outer membrane protein